MEFHSSTKCTITCWHYRCQWHYNFLIILYLTSTFVDFYLRFVAVFVAFVFLLRLSICLRGTFLFVNWKIDRRIIWNITIHAFKNKKTHRNSGICKIFGNSSEIHKNFGKIRGIFAENPKNPKINCNTNLWVKAVFAK